MAQTKYNVICFFGRPAGGKTGPTDDAEADGFVKIVSSDEVKKYYNDPSLSVVSNSGSLWSDETVNKVMGHLLSQKTHKKRGFCLDGYPRTPGQFSFLMEFVKKNNWSIIVIWVDTPTEVCRARVATRRFEYEAKGLVPRLDDATDVHEKRLTEYEKYGPKTLESFRRAGVRVERINGLKSKEEVIAASRSAIYE